MTSTDMSNEMIPIKTDYLGGMTWPKMTTLSSDDNVARNVVHVWHPHFGRTGQSTTAMAPHCCTLCLLNLKPMGFLAGFDQFGLEVEYVWLLGTLRAEEDDLSSTVVAVCLLEQGKNV